MSITYFNYIYHYQQNLSFGVYAILKSLPNWQRSEEHASRNKLSFQQGLICRLAFKLIAQTSLASSVSSRRPGGPMLLVAIAAIYRP